MSRLTELRPNLWTVDVSLPEYSVRGAVILGDKRAVVWDTLTHPDDMAELATIIYDMPYHVVYTHADWDHIWGTAGLPGRPERIIAHRHCLERFADDVPETLAKMREQSPGKWVDVQLIAPTQTFDNQLTLDLGNVTLELHHMPGHTLDCIVGWIPQWGILLGGDVMETPLPVVNDESPVRAWLQSLKDWAQNDKLVRTIPAHGTIDGRVCLDSTVSYLEKLLGDEDFPADAGLDDFYQNTHIKNLAIVRGE